MIPIKYSIQGMTGLVSVPPYILRLFLVHSESESCLFFFLCFLLSSESRECLLSRLSCFSRFLSSCFRFFSSCFLFFLLLSSSDSFSSSFADVVGTGMFVFSTPSVFKLGGKLDSSEGGSPLQTFPAENLSQNKCHF